jgi:hypothetical protein
MLASVLGSAVASVVGFVAVGFLAGPKSVRFEWEIASVFGTAVGTTFLAVVTGTLAWSTARDVAATERIARDGELDRRDRVKPTVLVEPYAFDVGFQLRIRVRNIGLGPALAVAITAANPVIDAKNIAPAYLAALEPESDWSIITAQVTPPEGESDAWGQLPVPPNEWSQMDKWTLDGDYLDRYLNNAGDVIDVRDMRD